MSEVEPQVWVGAEEPTPEKVDPIKNSEDAAPKKPKGGLWTSTLKREDGEVSSAWIEWMKGEKYSTCQDPKAWILYPKEDLSVYTINDVQDAAGIMKPDPRYRGMTIEEYTIDWAHVFGIEEYDAIHLTDEGQWRTRFPNKGWIDENGDRVWEKKTTDYRKYSLYGWDCECFLWEGWNFTEVEYAGPVEIPKVEA